MEGFSSGDLPHCVTNRRCTGKKGENAVCTFRQVRKMSG